MKIDIVTNTDDNYVQHAMALLCSVFENNSNQIHVHVLTQGLSTDNTGELKGLCNRYGNQLTIYQVDESRLEGVQFRKARPLTKAAYYRLLLASIISSDIDKILYLDCDMIVTGELTPLYEIDLTGYALAATADYMPTNDQHRQQLNLEFDERTFCSGIMMINLNYWREHDSEKDLLAFAKKPRNPVYLHDQDVLNHVFSKHWFRLPPKWNRIVFNIVPGGPKFGYKRADIREYLHSPMVVHYANKVKPWYDMWMPMRGYYREYLKKSGYKNIRYEKINIKQRLNLDYVILRYLYKYYVLPLIPQLLFMLFHDIYKLVAVFICPTKLRDKFYYKQMGL